jgi:hypothetical protein
MVGYSVIKRGLRGLLFLYLLFVLLPVQAGYPETQGKGQGEAPALSVSPTRHDFGILNVPVTSKSRVFTISNSGTADLVVSAITVSDAANYSLEAEAGQSPCGSLTPRVPAGGQCTFAVTFFPKSEGILDAEITIDSNDPVTPRMRIPMMGFGILCRC